MKVTCEFLIIFSASVCLGNMFDDELNFNNFSTHNYALKETITLMENLADCSKEDIKMGMILSSLCHVM